MVNFYRASIPNAANQAYINEYLKGSKRKDKILIKWTDKAIEAFEACKLSLQNAFLISHPVAHVP